MVAKSLPSIKWTRTLLKLPIFVFVLVYGFIVFLKFNQPVSGYLPTGGVNDFYYGFIERMLGESYSNSYSPPLYINKSLGFYFGYLGNGPIIAALTLLAFNKKKIKLFTTGVVFFLLHGIGNGALYAIVTGFTILVMRFRPAVKLYFKS